jgi:hypothetical protein
MPHNPILSPTHPDNDVLILEGVLHGVVEEGARYGLTQPRRDLLALTLQTLLRSMREGWEGDLAQTFTILQTGRPSPPHGRDDGHPDLSAQAPRLPRRAGTD